jgi:hypothetical protein
MKLQRKKFNEDVGHFLDKIILFVKVLKFLTQVWRRKMSRFKINLFAFMFCFILIFWGLLQAQAGVKTDTHLPLESVLQLLQKSVVQDTIISTVQRYGVDFKLDWRIAVSLARAGASDHLLEIIDNNFRDILRINFKNWYPYGGCNRDIAPDGSYIVVSDTTNAFPGVSTTDVYPVSAFHTLCIRVENSTFSVFTLGNRMLKVFRPPDRTIPCNDAAALSADSDFIIKADGVFEYNIADFLDANGQLHGLGFAFGPGNFTNLKISAWFQ